MNRKKSATLQLSAICVGGLIAFGSAAIAQQAGTYTGQTADGHPVSITVGVDPNNGDFEVPGAGFNFTLVCDKTGETFGSGWAIGFTNGADIINHKFAYAFDYPESYLPFSMTFHGKLSVKGKVALRDAAFNPATGYTTEPTKLQFCDSDQPFTATYSGADASPAAAPGTVRIQGRDFQTVRSFPVKASQ